MEWCNGIIFLCCGSVILRKLTCIVHFNGSDSRFSQQELPACKPILSPGWVSILFSIRFGLFRPQSLYSFVFFMLPSRFWFQVVSIFITIGIVFIPIGFAALFASERVIFSACFYVMLCTGGCLMSSIN